MTVSDSLLVNDMSQPCALLTTAMLRGTPLQECFVLLKTACHGVKRHQAFEQSQEQADPQAIDMQISLGTADISRDLDLAISYSNEVTVALLQQVRNHSGIGLTHTQTKQAVAAPCSGLRKCSHLLSIQCPNNPVGPH